METIPNETISVLTFRSLDPADYLLIDVRDEAAHSLAGIPGSMCISRDAIREFAASMQSHSRKNKAAAESPEAVHSDSGNNNAASADLSAAHASLAGGEHQSSDTLLPGGMTHLVDSLLPDGKPLPTDKLLILYCAYGLLSDESAALLRGLGYRACNLEGGYTEWLRVQLDEEKQLHRSSVDSKEMTVSEHPDLPISDSSENSSRQNTETAKNFSVSNTGAAKDSNVSNTGTEKDSGVSNTGLTDIYAERREEVEKSLRKKFRKAIMSKFARAVSDYDLIQPGDHIAVCISGGKDSMLMAKCFQELKRRNKFPFELTFLVMDPGYADVNRGMIERNAALLGIPITVFDSQIFDAVYTIEKSPCYLCARMRRGHLYSKAKELGCNKIALGHHYDDVIETTLMSILYSGQTQTMMPKLHSTNFEGMELIRPMYLIREDEIRHWRDYNGLQFIRCACRFTDTCSLDENSPATGDSRSKRIEAKQLIAELKKTTPTIEANIFRSMENIHLNAVLGYKKNGAYHSFLDEY